ncbi:MAG: hypothetical protein EOO43_00575 [Flavobacterium sp.]|nr:MAG: hypothetical protein EOO43_00575 [Flavobacterium sp.]
MNVFKKIFFRNELTTYLTESQQNLKSLLPQNWNGANFDYNKNNHNKGYGGVIKTGKINNIMVLDFDSMKSYKDVCLLYPDVYKHYTVRTRRGMHVYFTYDETVKRYNADKVDTQSDNKLVICEETPVTRYNGEKYVYSYVGGEILPMPKILKEKCILQGQEKNNTRSFTHNNINYDYEISDEQILEIIEQLKEKHPEYLTQYDHWLKFTTVMKTINRFDIWDNTNRQYSGYSRSGNIKIWNGIKMCISPNFFCNLLGMSSIKFSKKVEALDSQVDKENCVYINKKFFELSNDDGIDDFADTDIIVIQSGTGTGKTTCVAAEFASYQFLRPEITLLSIVNLISLANQQLITFKSKGVDICSYRDNKVNPALIMCQNSVICINSLHKLHSCDFRNKIIYIDEVHALCQSLTHNNTIHNQRLVFNTLIRAIKTCHKVIVSDAHILNATMHLLSERMYDGVSTYCHYINTYNKFQDVCAVKYNDENSFFGKVKNKVLNGESFSFACDSKDIVTKWYNWLWAEASVETQNRMLLYTSETDSEICDDWKDKIIFYSPKISTGVDVTILHQTEQFLYITGKSVSSITLYQMATRTRNMSQLNYYSSCSSFEAKYKTLEDCHNQVISEFMANLLGISSCKLDEEIKKDFVEKERIYRDIYVENTYVLDYYKTYTLRYFENELRGAGFKIIKSNEESSKLDTEVMTKMELIADQITEDKFEQLIMSLNEEEVEIPEGLSQMKKRVDILNLCNKEELEEYRDLIEDEHKFEQFLNYNRLKKPYDHCKMKLTEVVNGKMAYGLQSNVWNKIKYVHMLAKNSGIKDDLFNLRGIVCPDIADKKIQGLIKTIKVLYRKRDTIEPKDYQVMSLSNYTSLC